MPNPGDEKNTETDPAPALMVISDSEGKAHESDNHTSMYLQTRLGVRGSQSSERK